MLEASARFWHNKTCLHGRSTTCRFVFTCRVRHLTAIMPHDTVMFTWPVTHLPHDLLIRRLPWWQPSRDWCPGIEMNTIQNVINHCLFVFSVYVILVASFNSRPDNKCIQLCRTCWETYKPHTGDLVKLYAKPHGTRKGWLHNVPFSIEQCTCVSDTPVLNLRGDIAKAFLTIKRAYFFDVHSSRSQSGEIILSWGSGPATKSWTIIVQTNYTADHSYTDGSP